MALKNSKRYQGEISRNAGIFKVDQVELVGQSSAPTDGDVGANSRIYFDTTDNVFYGRSSSLWFPLGGVLKVNSITTSTTLTTSQSGQIFKCNSAGGSLILTLPSAATSGIIYYIVNDNDSQATKSLHIQESGFAGNNHQWIAGTSGTFIALNTRADNVVLVSDGSTAWLTVARFS